MREILKKIYYRFSPLFDWLNNFTPLYQFFAKNFFENTNDALKFLGAKIEQGAEVKKIKKIKSLPINLEVNENAFVDSIFLKTQSFCLIEKNVYLKELIVQNNTIVTKNKIYLGDELKTDFITFSFDIEWLPNQDFNKENFKILLNIFKNYQIPATWAICGNIFDFLKKEINELKKERYFEIAYHSFDHCDYSKIDTKEVIFQIQKLNEIRKKYNLKLETFVFPYNKLNHLDLLVKEGKLRYFRGYIARANPKIINFEGKFLYFNTSDFLSGKSIDYYLKNYKKIISQNHNFFSHLQDWETKEDLLKLDKFISLVKLFCKGKVKKFNDFNIF